MLRDKFFLDCFEQPMQFMKFLDLFYFILFSIFYYQIVFINYGHHYQPRGAFHLRMYDMQGTAFSMTERDRLDLRGLLPPTVMSPEMQIERFSEFSISLPLVQVYANSAHIVWKHLIFPSV